ncbi:MAG: carboxymuconolactone decarboxylase family protein [Deltaproteobacteria bacterium]|nr:carboxymuconolactone decarboxylase family protein [Deltaproteobacteria bacterium]
MYLPASFTSFQKKFSDVYSHYEALTKACRVHGPLDRKQQDMIKLGIAIGQQSKGAVMSQTRKALSSGATAEEIEHALLLSLTTVGFQAMIAAMGWVNEVIEKFTPGEK